MVCSGEAVDLCIDTFQTEILLCNLQKRLTELRTEVVVFQCSAKQITKKTVTLQQLGKAVLVRLCLAVDPGTVFGIDVLEET